MKPINQSQRSGNSGVRGPIPVYSPGAWVQRLDARFHIVVGKPTWLHCLKKRHGVCPPRYPCSWFSDWVGSYRGQKDRARSRCCHNIWVGTKKRCHNRPMRSRPYTYRRARNTRIQNLGSEIEGWEIPGRTRNPDGRILGCHAQRQNDHEFQNQEIFRRGVQNPQIPLRLPYVPDLSLPDHLTTGRAIRRRLTNIIRFIGGLPIFDWGFSID
jgi:hypothetical protein